MVNEWIAGADLCDQQGFNRPATVLRIEANKRDFTAFVLFERSLVTSRWSSSPKKFFSQDGRPVGLFRNEERARLVASERNIKSLRESNVLNHVYGLLGMAEHINDPSVFTFEVNVSRILGTPFRIDPGLDEMNSGDAYDLPPMFPSTATDDQMREIASLFKGIFFYVEAIQSSDLHPHPRYGR